MKLTKTICAVSAVAVAASSCVNETYDFSKGIDTTIGADVNIGLPVGSTRKFLIGEFLEFDSENPEGPISVLDGEYHIGVTADEPITQLIEFDISSIEESIDFPAEGIKKENTVDIDIEDLDFDDNASTAQQQIDKLHDILESLSSSSIPVDQYKNDLQAIESRLENYRKITIVGNTPKAIFALVDAFEEDAKTIKEITDNLKTIPGISDITDYTLPEIELEKDESFNKELSFDLSTGDNDNMSFDVRTELPSAIKSMSRIELDSDLDIVIYLSYGKMKADGLKITLPEFLEVEESAGNGWEIKGNSIVFVKDYELVGDENEENALKIELGITAINIGESDLTTNPDNTLSLALDGDVKIEGTIKANTYDMFNDEDLAETQIPSDVQSVVAVKLGELEFKNVQGVSLDLSEELGELAGMSIPFLDEESMPSFIADNEVVLDVYNPAILIDVVNGSPITLNLSARIDAYKGGNSIFDEGETLEIAAPEIAAGSKTRIVVSRKGYENEGVESIVKDKELGKLIKSLPEEIRIDDVKVGTTENMTIGFTEGETEYEFGIYYSVNAPLAFGKDFKIEYELEEPIGGLNDVLNPEAEGSNFNMDLDEISLSFDFVNGLPIGLALTAIPVDLEGNDIGSGVELRINGAENGKEDNYIKPATKNEAEVTTKFKLMIKVTDKEVMKTLDGIRLAVSGTSSEESEGISLREDQGLQLKNISARVIAGIAVEL